MARRLLIPAIGLLLALPLQAAAQNREHQQIFADLRMLHEQTQLLRAAVAELAEALKAVNSRVDEQGNLTRKLFADQGVQIGGLTENARILREKMDATNVSLSKDAHEMETIRQELAAQRTLLTQIIALLTPPPVPVEGGAGDPAAAGVTPPPATAGGTPPAPQLPPAPQNPQRLYDTAFGDYATGQYDMAILGFQYYIETFPTSPDVPKARFYVAESHYGKGALKESVTAYEQVITLHKGTEWEPQALYKQGLAYRDLGQTDRARANWELVRKSFPDSPAAMMAAQGLARIVKTQEKD